MWVVFHVLFKHNATLATHTQVKVQCWIGPSTVTMCLPVSVPRKDSFLVKVAQLKKKVSSFTLLLQPLHTQTYVPTPKGYEQYLYWRKRSLEYLPLPHVTIFLDASPQCCYERIHARARVSNQNRTDIIREMSKCPNPGLGYPLRRDEPTMDAV